MLRGDGSLHQGCSNRERMGQRSEFPVFSAISTSWDMKSRETLCICQKTHHIIHLKSVNVIKLYLSKAAFFKTERDFKVTEIKHARCWCT